MSNIWIYYDAASITIIMKKEVPRYINRLGLKTFPINSLHLSRDINYLKKVFRRLQYRPSKSIIDRIKSSVITGEAYDTEVYTS
jgi:hypothetical protein